MIGVMSTKEIREIYGMPGYLTVTTLEGVLRQQGGQEAVDKAYADAGLTGERSAYVSTMLQQIAALHTAIHSAPSAAEPEPKPVCQKSDNPLPATTAKPTLKQQAAIARVFGLDADASFEQLERAAFQAGVTFLGMHDDAVLAAKHWRPKLTGLAAATGAMRQEAVDKILAKKP